MYVRNQRKEIVSRTEVADIGFSFRRVKTGTEEQQLHKRLPCGGVHRDSEHRIVSATIPIHAAYGRGLTQGIPCRLNEEENQKLKQYAAACGLSAAEFMRQLCKGNAPQPEPQAEFWQLMNTLYEVHAVFKKCVHYYPNAAETCQEIEEFILELQQAATSPRRFDVEELIEKGAV